MDATPTASTAATDPRRKARLTACAGGVLYLLVLTAVVGEENFTSAVPRALALLLATGMLVGLLRRTPLTALVLTLAGITLVVALGRSFTPDRFLPYLAVDLAVGHLVATRSRAVSAPAALLTGLVQVLVIAVFSRGGEMPTQVLVATLALGTASVVGLLLRERREHASALRTQAVAEAVTAERLRIARELHDMVAHSIGVIALQAGVGARVIDTRPDEARAALTAVETTSRETLAGLRRTLVALRQADPQLGPVPTLADLDRLAATTADAGVRVELRRSGDVRPLPAEIELAAFRIVQEALTNVVRHAGTGHCRVGVDYGEEDLSVEIVDDGSGTGETGHGFGLVGMRERAALLNGRLTAGTRPEGGFRVAAELPLPAEAVAR